ncbi:tetratricopeptide repeat protein [Streptomyces sp. NPDC002845]
MSAVTGMGGIGKTALAIEAAHQACSRGWFPGGTLFVDLRGYDDNPVTADQAVLALLDALDVRGTNLPKTTARQYDAYRGHLAGRAGRTLLILDNASAPSQFLPLLPGTGHHRVLITSRDRPDSLPLRLVDLETLAEDDSAALVTRALQDFDSRDDRPSREPDALRELTSLCGHLPLALQIASAMLRRRRHRDIASLVADIKSAGDPTSVLDDSSRGTDQYGRSLVLRPVLETSYRRLPPDQARLLRLLALAPGSDTGTEAVATLADLDEEGTLRLLEDLAAASLATATVVGGAVRWRLHDLVRAYGTGVVADDAGLREEGETARERVLGFYSRWADAADDRLRWMPGLPEPARFATRAEALAWFDRERAGLVAAVRWGPEQRRYASVAAKLATRLSVYLHWRRYFDDWITVSLAAKEAASRVKDRLFEAIAEDNLGFALYAVGRTKEAIKALNHARDLYQAIGNQHHEAFAWDHLGLALGGDNRGEEAINAFTHALDLFEAAEDHRSVAFTLHNLGYVLTAVGRTAEAVKTLTRARDLRQTIKDRHGSCSS